MSTKTTHISPEQRFLQQVGGSFPFKSYEDKCPLKVSIDATLQYFKNVQTVTEAVKKLDDVKSIFPENQDVEEAHAKLSQLQLQTMEKVQEISGDKWQSYVVRKSGWSSNKDLNYGGAEAQVIYGNWMHQTMQIAGRCLKDENWSFEQLESFCALRRNQIAEMRNITNAKLYGLIKDTNQWTPCHSGYTYLRGQLLKMHESIDSEKKFSSYVHVTSSEAEFSSITKNSKNIYAELILKLKELNIPFKCDAYFSEIDGKPVRLSEVLFCPTHPLTSDIEKKYLYYDESASHSVTVFHTKAKEKKIQKIMAHAKQIYLEACKESDLNPMIEKLGMVYWWICQCKPYLWGDPSIAETMIKAVLYSKGYEFPAWKEDTVPWEKVMEEKDVVQFGKNFHTLFDGQAHPIS